MKEVANPTNSTGKVYFPNLDGLRFLSFLGVFFYHSFATEYEHIQADGFYKFVKYFLTWNGNLGVNFFFVLSGFLITYLLLVEKNTLTGIRIGKFYMRRILRIWPLFYFCVLFGFFVFPKIKMIMGQVPNETAEIGYYLVFLNNFNFIENGLPDASTLGILWSVAIEEQFYLFWPLILYFIPAKHYITSFIAIVIASLCYRYVNFSDPDILENHTFSCISDMVVGGIFAYLSFFSPSFKDSIRKAPKIIWICLYLAVVVLVLYRLEIFTGQLWLAFDRIIFAVLFGFVIVEQNYADRSFFKMSRFKIISRLGIYTYGLYCLHAIGILVAAVVLHKMDLNTNVYQVIFLQSGLALAISIALAMASYHLYEAPFLKLKERFSRTSTTKTGGKETEVAPKDTTTVPSGGKTPQTVYQHHE